MSPSTEIPKTYDPNSVEEHWLQEWKDEDNYFDPVSTKPQFIIDTPPPIRQATSILETGLTGVISILSHGISGCAGSTLCSPRGGGTVMVFPPK